jgi:hypothetical protein
MFPLIDYASQHRKAAGLKYSRMHRWVTRFDYRHYLTQRRKGAKRNRSFAALRRPLARMAVSRTSGPYVIVLWPE